MAEQQTSGLREPVAAHMRTAAVQAAFHALTKHSTLRGPAAMRAAHEAVTAATPGIRAQQVQELAGLRPRRAAGIYAAAAAVVAADLVVFATAVTRGPRWSRIAAGAAGAAHIGFAVYAKSLSNKVRAAAQAAQHKPADT